MPLMASSMIRERAILTTSSINTDSSTPTVSTQSVAVLCVGMTRSYTCML